MFDIIGKRRYGYVISSILVITGLVFILATFIPGGAAGLQFSIAYTGGTVWEVHFQDGTPESGRGTRGARRAGTGGLGRRHHRRQRPGVRAHPYRSAVAAAARDRRGLCCCSRGGRAGVGVPVGQRVAPRRRRPTRQQRPRVGHTQCVGRTGGHDRTRGFSLSFSRCLRSAFSLQPRPVPPPSLQPPPRPMPPPSLQPRARRMPRWRR